MNEHKKYHFLLFICLHKQTKYLLILWLLGVLELPLIQEHHLFLANQGILGDLLGPWDQVALEYQGSRAGTGNDHSFEFFHFEVRQVNGLEKKETPTLMLNGEWTVIKSLIIKKNYRCLILGQ